MGGTKEEWEPAKVAASPFLKWAGGKGQLLAQIQSFLPAEFTRYIEVFVGGGAVFFHLHNLGRIAHGAILNDLDRELMNSYRVLKDKAKVDDLIRIIRDMSRHAMSADYYYSARAWDRDPHFLERRSPTERAARVIFLNHTCFNGLYRLNSKEQFNVPYGKWSAPPSIFDEENLWVCHLALQGVELEQGSFESCLDWAEEGDFVYLDPPYVPLSTTSSFTSYAKTPFGEKEQRDLSRLFRQLAERGCYVMLSNSNAPLVRQLYSAWNIHEVQARRAINSKGERRGAITELVVANY